ncbi:multicopper oxidase domain-containing protein [Marivirga atlantica]|jgi:FtsP/CotA-like multicopper oxidase with cupredoxin domain|uniref:Multicopper oxidase CueO n=1 Tax=Marivirga atlantica TaxID=1548457 RepID=A0A937AB25_9BACT|nr:multicopper oxidase domain-containing protein [Marivirga atlantica]MBL0766915.1 multicopper oxidase domain-containing protein [Marivirga atlantica]
MKEPFRINRRKFLAKAGASAAVTMIWPFFSSCDSQSSTTAKPELGKDFQPDIDLELKAVQRDLSILSGSKTKVWAYEGKLIKGNKEALQTLEGTYLGPVIKVSKGQKVRIRFQNDLPEESIVHWHGMHVPERYDGHPQDVINSGETYIYEYEVMNRAGTYWFHPHPHGRTGPQVYNGLAGLLLVTDEEEQQLNLPQGEYDLPVVIQDRTFDENNQLVYLNNGQMDRMTGFLGNRILINGSPEQRLNLKAGCKYRLRLLNGSNSRIYKLAWEDGSPVTVFGIDGSLLSTPKELPYLMLGPAKRVDVWLDLTDKPEGTELTMKNASFPLEIMSGGMMGDGGMMQGAESDLPQGNEYPVFTVLAKSSGSNDHTLQRQLAKPDYIDPSTARNLNAPRQFTFAMGHMEWTINGRTWETTEVADEETVKLGSTEVWELINGGGMMGNDDNGGGMMDGHGMMGDGGMMGGENDMMNNQGMMGNMMQMPHPIHIHQVQFNIIERDVANVDPELWDAIKDGFVDEGWHDTVLLMPGMKAKIIMQFKDFKGLFVYHCHNLEHEDMGMMRNFKIV